MLRSGRKGLEKELRRMKSVIMLSLALGVLFSGLRGRQAPSIVQIVGVRQPRTPPLAYGTNPQGNALLAEKTGQVGVLPDSAEACCELGESYLQGSFKSAEAVAAFKRAIQLKPDLARAYAGLGWAYLDLRGWRSAISSLVTYQDEIDNCKQSIGPFKHAILLRPDYAAAYFGLGLAFERLGQPQQALSALQESVRLKPEYVEAYSELSRAYEALSDYRQAVISKERAIALKSAPHQSRIDQAGPFRSTTLEPRVDDAFFDQIELGRLYEKLLQPERAIEPFKKAVDIKPDDSFAHFHLARAYIEAANFESGLAEHGVLLRLCEKSEDNVSRLICSRRADEILQLIKK